MLETWMDFNEKKNVFGLFLFMLYGLIVGWVGAPGGLLCDEATGANQLPPGTSQERDPLDQVTHAQSHVSVFYILKVNFFVFFKYFIRHGFICRRSDCTVPKDAGI